MQTNKKKNLKITRKVGAIDGATIVCYLLEARKVVLNGLARSWKRNEKKKRKRNEKRKRRESWTKTLVLFSNFLLYKK